MFTATKIMFLSVLSLFKNYIQIICVGHKLSYFTPVCPGPINTLSRKNGCEYDNIIYIKIWHMQM